MGVTLKRGLRGTVSHGARRTSGRGRERDLLAELDASPRHSARLLVVLLRVRTPRTIEKVFGAHQTQPVVAPAHVVAALAQPVVAGAECADGVAGVALRDDLTRDIRVAQVR